MADFVKRVTTTKGAQSPGGQGYSSNHDMLAKRGMVYTEAEGRKDFGRGIYTENPDLDRWTKATKAPPEKPSVSVQTSEPKETDTRVVRMKKAATISHNLHKRLR